MTNIERFRAITKEMAETYEKKNHDYGDSFGRSLDKRGLMAALVRMEDKMNRLDSLAEKDAQVNESLADTLTDLANYAIMTASWIRRKLLIPYEGSKESYKRTIRSLTDEILSNRSEDFFNVLDVEGLKKSVFVIKDILSFK